MTDPFRARLEQALADTYAFERELGGGGMSRTYLARDLTLNRRVVVKVLAPELLQGLSVERFKREVLMAAQLQHPHVVPVLVSGDADGLPWFSMPYVDGESLRLRMDRGALSMAECVSILRDVSRALAYAHSHGVVHRDIKPDNVLLSGGSATVTDFGIAKAISASRTEAGGNALTQAGMAIGTPAYMAPEQAAADPDLDHRADLYAFGGMAYELLSGQQLFAGRTPAKVLAAHLGEAPRELQQLAPQVPRNLASLVMQCLAKDPDARPANASAIVAALDAVTGTGAAAGQLEAGSSPTTGGGVQGQRVRLARALGLWIVAAVALLAATWGATVVVGLPDWTIAAAVAVVLAGLPAVLGTWWVQRAAHRAVTATPTITDGGRVASPGTMATFAMRASPHVTWTRTWRAGAIAAGALALSAAGFTATRALGIGPAASLIGRGDFGQRETIVVADFRPPANDSLLGTTVGEALRTDLAQSANLDVLTRATTRDILDRMQRPRESVVYYALAREIATREGARAVVDGEIVRLGGSYVLSARLVSAVDGVELEKFRETADNDAALVPAVGALSRAIRERVGESLKGIRRSAPLERVTTSSLPALRKYVEGTRVLSDQGDDRRALELLQDAVEIDSTFAMAWRRIAVVHSNDGQLARADSAIRVAMRFRDRLSDEERAFTEAFFYSRSTEPDYSRAISAYEDVLRRDSLNSTALNNLSVLYSELRQFDDAKRVLWTSVATPSAAGVNFTNLLLEMNNSGDSLGADSASALFAERLPDNADLWEGRMVQLSTRGQVDSMAQLSRSVLGTARNRRQAFVSRGMQAYRAALRGRPMEAVRFKAGVDSVFNRETAPDRLPGSSRADSAFATALILGDASAARMVLGRAIPSDSFAEVPPAARPWFVLLRAAAVAGDSTTARAALAGAERDLLPTAPLRDHQTALAGALMEIARNAPDAAIRQLRLAIAERASPDPEEAFLMGSLHDRAGRPDSAALWLERAITTPPANGFFLNGVYPPLARRRLAELAEARGDLTQAIRYYEAFLADWSDPEPTLQSEVDGVRARVAVLRARLAPG